MSLAVKDKNAYTRYLYELGYVNWHRPSNEVNFTLSVSEVSSEWKISEIVLDFEFGRYEIDKEARLRPARREFEITDLEFQLPINVRFGTHRFDIELFGEQRLGNSWVQNSMRFESFPLRIHPDPDYWIFLSCSYDPKDQLVVDLASHYAHASKLGSLQAREFDKPQDRLRKVQLLVNHTDATVVLQTPRYAVNGEITAPWIIWEHGVAHPTGKLKLSLADEEVMLEKQGPLTEFEPTLRFRRHEIETMHRCFSSAFAWLHQDLKRS